MHAEYKMKNVMKFLKNKSGATAIEYGLIAALIAVAVIGGVSALGGNANTTFTNVAACMGAAEGGTCPE
jgi:pilus assembly protein Flp/PilA